MAKIKFGERSINLPKSRAARIGLGSGLVVAGGFGFLPILGFWMISLGLVVLSVDLPSVRRWRRRSTVRLVGWWRGRDKERGARPKAGGKAPLRDSSIVP